MRLWHKDLIGVLPRQQLLGQWRECCLIAKQIAINGTPNHLLVNRINNYPLNHFYTYCMLVYEEMEERGYHPDLSKLRKWVSGKYQNIVPRKQLFDTPRHSWHNDRYLKQCLYNLDEKYDCGGISKEEWARIVYYFRYYF